MKKEDLVSKNSLNSILSLKEKVDNRQFFVQFESAVKNLEILNVEEQISRNFFLQQFDVA